MALPPISRQEVRRLDHSAARIKRARPRSGRLPAGEPTNVGSGLVALSRDHAVPRLDFLM
jgi:hypothetical protein